MDSTRFNKHCGFGFATAAALLGLSACGGDDDVPPDEPRIVASGFLSPRGLAFTPEGDLYVAESGVMLAQTSDTQNPPCLSANSCYTESGVISRVDLKKKADVAREPIIDGLPTLGDVGPADISFYDSNGYVAIGLATDPNNRTTLGDLGAEAAPMLGSFVRLRLDSDGELLPFVIGTTDVSGFERSYNNGAGNPDNGQACPVQTFGPCPVATVPSFDTNPFGITSGAGYVVVADAGANDLIEFKSDGTRKLLAVFPAEEGSDRVPSRVVQGPDGYFYVGEEAFGGGDNGARIYRVPPTGCNPVDACEVYSSGFTNVMDLEFDTSGNLYVLEYGPGDLVKIDTGGTRTVVYSGFKSPGGLALHQGAAYVTNKTTCYGVETISAFTGAVDCAASEYGEVWRIPLK